MSRVLAAMFMTAMRVAVRFAFFATSAAGLATGDHPAPGDADGREEDTQKKDVNSLINIFVIGRTPYN